MAFDWRKYLELARALEGHAGTDLDLVEAARRSAVSRAYYAAFCYARNYAVEYQGFSPRGDVDDHGKLKAHFKTGKTSKIAQRLDRLRQWRNECDYLDDVGPALKERVKEAIQEADKVLATLPPPSPPAPPAS
jgi:uncharacterized protein (UPF0332 family)